MNSWTIFYSWQSDLPFDTNQAAIRIAIRNVISDLETAALKITIDEATRDVPGSPDIPATIFDKIEISDVFLCDISTINKLSEYRKTPNPNVLIELGYAVAHVGWDRIIMLFNKAHGIFPDDLPFDIDRRRIIDYGINDGADNNGKSQLKRELFTAIKGIIDTTPLKPNQKRKKSNEEIKRI